jgi:hypothetical protein
VIILFVSVVAAEGQTAKSPRFFHHDIYFFGFCQAIIGQLPFTFAISVLRVSLHVAQAVWVSVLMGHHSLLVLDSDHILL